MQDNMTDTINNTLQTKLQSLVSFLVQITRGFDTVAEEIDCSNLKMAMKAVAVESKQYAKEITDQLRLLDITVPSANQDQLWEWIETNVHEQAGFGKGSEILALCNTCEIYFSKLYKEVLQESIPHKNFKAIIMYQLYAAECAFNKIRLLNALRFNWYKTTPAWVNGHWWKAKAHY